MDRTYRLLYLDLNDGVTRVEDIRAGNDDVALDKAYRACGHRKAELWDGLRQVAQIPRGDDGLRQVA